MTASPPQDAVHAHWHSCTGAGNLNKIGPLISCSITNSHTWLTWSTEEPIGGLARDTGSLWQQLTNTYPMPFATLLEPVTQTVALARLPLCCPPPATVYLTCMAAENKGLMGFFLPTEAP